MDLGTISIGVTCIIICAMPFVLTTRSRNKKEKQLLLLLNNLAIQQQSNISKYDVFGYYAIGIDEIKKNVFYQFKAKEIEKQQFVDLTTIKKCKIENVSKSTDGNSRVVEQLNLNLSFIDKNKPDIILEFYNAEVNFQLNGEIQLIEKWNTLINNMLNSLK